MVRPDRTVSFTNLSSSGGRMHGTHPLGARSDERIVQETGTFSGSLDSSASTTPAASGSLR